MQIFEKIRPFAADKHFGAREISWLSITDALLEAIKILSLWTRSEDENLRRFASEATRLRGIWREYISGLKQNPKLGFAILEPLRSDSSKYVRDSVGNCLNDASKTNSDFIRELCARLEKESGAKETAYIVKKALRSIKI